MWHKIEFSSDQLLNGTALRMLHAFEKIMIGSLKDMAVYMTTTPFSQPAILYFTPNCLPECRDLMTAYGAESCDAPKAQDVHMAWGTVSSKRFLEK